VPIALGWELANGVLALTATTPGQAAICHDSWSVSPSLALTAVTIDDASVPGETTYVSRAAVDGSSLAHDTTYTFSYAIVMRTGESLWVGSRSLTVTVGRDGSMTEPARAAEPPQA
jgi:hypothetical protein